MADIKILNNDIVSFEGKVGIGTNNPLYKLHIGGSTYVNSGTLFLDSGNYLMWGNSAQGIRGVNDTSLEFLVGSSTKMYIKSNGNIGIGTTSPSKKLDVAGDWILDGINGGHFENYQWGSQLDISELTSGGWARANRIVTSDSDASVFYGVFGGGTTLNYSYWNIGSAASESTNYNNSNGIFLLNNGNVGVGTITPAGKLTVDIDSTGAVLDLKRDDGVNGRLYLTFGAAQSNFYSSGLYTFNVAGSEKMRITSAGNVGIGTTAPSSKLQVDGDFNISNKYIYNQGTVATTGAGVANGSALTWKQGDDTINTAYNYRVRLTTSGTGTNSGATYLVEYDPDTDTYNVRMVSRSGSSSNHPLLVMSGSQMIAYTNHTTAYNIQYHVEAISVADSDGTLHNMGADYHWQRDVNDLYYIDGNVGIGTSSPSYDLEVNGGSSPASLGIISANELQSVLRMHTSTNEGVILESDDGSTTNFYIKDAGSGTARFTLDRSSGNVGIGTTNPTSSLHVSGLQANTSSTSVSNPSGTLRLEYAGGYNTNDFGSSLVFTQEWFNGYSAQIAMGQITGYKQGGNGTYGGGLTFWTANGNTNALAERMRIDSAGNVGIGTTSPASNYAYDIKLDIVAPQLGGVPLRVVRDSSITNYGALIHLGAKNSNGDIIHYGSISGNIEDNTAGSEDGFFTIRTIENGTEAERMRVTSAGNVGIGTSSPSSRGLQINKANADSGLVITRTGTGAAEFQQFIDGSGNIRFNNFSSTSAIFYTANTERMRIGSNGYVGIGTTSPARKLHVDGAIGVNGSIGHMQPVLNVGTAQWNKIGTFYTSQGGNNLKLELHCGQGYNANFGQHSVVHVIFRTSNGSSNDNGFYGSCHWYVEGYIEEVTTIKVKQISASQYEFYGFFNNFFGDSFVKADCGLSDYWVSDSSLNTGEPTGTVITANKEFATKSNSRFGGSVVVDGNVGIGTTSPAYKLDIDSGTSDSGLRLIGSSSTYTGGFIANTGSGSASLYFDASNGDFGGADYMVIRQLNSLRGEISMSANTPAFDISMADVPKFTVLQNGNVGIGTTTPNFKLQVNGDFAAEDNIYLTDAGTVRGKFELNSSDRDDVDIKAVSLGSNMKFFTVDTERMRIDSSGNVGIGTTTPTQKLDVIGHTIIGTSGGGYKYYLRRPSDGSATTYFGFHSANNADFGITNGSGGGDIRLQSNNGSFRFYTGASYANQVFIINSSGNVGIGTTSPSDKLDVNGNLSIYGNKIYNGAANNSAGLDFSGSYANLSGYNGIRFYSSTAGIGSMSERMRITSAGNVGIGTNSPSYKFQISETDYARITLHQTTTGAHWQWGNDGSNMYAYYSNSGVRAIDIKQNGNVGIGTTSPAAKLHITSGTEGDCEVIIEADTDNNNENDNPRLILKQDGGLTTAKLGLTGDGAGTDYTGSISNSAYFGNDANAGLQLYTNNTARLTIDSSGRVGIGTTSPGYKLDVSGTIRATGDVIAYSDARVKENVKTIDNALDKVTQLRGVSYNKIGETEEKIGVIAQEIEKVLPQVVQEDDNGMKSVAYGNIVGVLIEAIKELKDEVNELKSQINGSTK